MSRDRHEGPREVTPEEMPWVIAHEIRNHLAVIQGFGSEIYQRWDDLPDDLKRDSVGRMTDRARYLNAVVSNLMTMLRLESERVWPETAPVVLGELIRSLFGELEDLAPARALKLELTDDVGEVSADASRLRQVLTNLVVNAARYSPAGTPIALSVGGDERGAFVKVRDDGEGIPEEYAERVFDKFTRFNEKGAGLGLGLFVSRELMRSMDGDLLLESPRGATFTCILPYAES